LNVLGAARKEVEQRFCAADFEQSDLDDLHRRVVQVPFLELLASGAQGREPVDGLCLVWAPRAEIVNAILEAGQAGPYATLTASSSIVLDDLDAVLNRARGVDVPGHDGGCAFAAEAIAAARDDHWSAAQSHTASGLGHVLQRTPPIRSKRSIPANSRSQLSGEDSKSIPRMCSNDFWSSGLISAS
jgi:hypothetical protein